MTRFRFSRPAQADIQRILGASLERWGTAGRRRYALTLAAGLRLIATDPSGPLTRGRPDLPGHVRSLHLSVISRRARRVARPVHVIFFRLAQPELVEIVRIPHERMDPGSHLR